MTCPHYYYYYFFIIFYLYLLLLLLLLFYVHIFRYNHKWHPHADASFSPFLPEYFSEKKLQNSKIPPGPSKINCRIGSPATLIGSCALFMRILLFGDVNVCTMHGHCKCRCLDQRLATLFGGQTHAVSKKRQRVVWISIVNVASDCRKWRNHDDWSIESTDLQIAYRCICDRAWPTEHKDVFFTCSFADPINRGRALKMHDRNVQNRGCYLICQMQIAVMIAMLRSKRSDVCRWCPTFS